MVTFEKHPQSRGNRPFNILPECSLRPICITIDKTILPSLYNLAGVKVAKDQVDDLWNTTFDLTRGTIHSLDKSIGHYKTINAKKNVHNKNMNNLYQNVAKLLKNMYTNFQIFMISREIIVKKK